MGPGSEAGTTADTESATIHKTHSDPRNLAEGLAGQPDGAAPAAKTRVIVGGLCVGLVAVRAPAVVIAGAGEFAHKFRARALLRTFGKTPRKIRAAAPFERVENIASANLVAEEMRRRRPPRRFRSFSRHPAAPRKMKTADPAALVAPRTGDIVEPARKTGHRADIGRRHPDIGGLA